MTKDQEYSVKYWKKIFKSYGFVPVSQEMFPEGDWFIRGKLYISYKKAEDLPVSPAFNLWYNDESSRVVINPPRWVIPIIFVTEKCFKVKGAEFLQQIKWLSEPEKLPLLLGVPWANGIVTEMLKEAK